MKYFFSILLSSLFAIGLISCDKDKSPLNIPSQYDGSAYPSNTTKEYAVRTQLDALVTEIKKGRTTGAVLDYPTLLSLYQTGNPGLQTLATSYYDSRLNGSGKWLDELSKSSGGAYTPGTPSGQGGVFNGYLFDENGLEMEQMVEKGLFGAALYHEATALMRADVSQSELDRIIALYGAHPDFPNTPTAAKAANPDKNMANYAARRDKNDGAGLYTQIKQNFLTAQAAIQAGADYDAERDAALANLRLNWEKVNFATVINYCHSVVSKMSATSPTDSDKAASLHAYGECVGFVHGWRTIPQADKKITDAEIDEILVLLNAPYNATPTSYKFITDPLNELPKLTQIIQKLKNLYQFTDQEVEDFRKNWVAEQGR
ncbi:MAG: hypothetical protein JNM22_11670 [Saprospiraceae bacterium]|nr:hypothetical protein [Saprospiraceae bacterium]